MSTNEYNVKLYTIGYRDRDLEDFLDLLDQTGINTLVDIRSNPRSKNNQKFCAEELRESIEDAGKTYHWAGKQLGGRRKPAKVSQNTALQDESLRSFADYMQTDTFHVAATQLINLAAESEMVIMCSALNPRTSHRALIADYLLLRGVQVFNIISDVQVEEHLLSEFARRESSELIYDRAVKQYN